ncbi:MAG TPA: EAL domain-containing protein [Acidimicrobiales bacterium]|nr:EAL domain-containing protein [Acidimicrobiales bacterium]
MSEKRAVTFDELLDRRNLRPVYQPIIDLVSGEQLGAEALARWPELAIAPEAAFLWARHEGRLAELDEVCRNAAIDGAIAHGLPRLFELFVNLEPSVLGPDTATRLLDRAAGQTGLVVEITERALLRRPAELLRAVNQLRGSGCAIALDDVGAVPTSLALLPFVAPDVIKLDVSLIQRWPNVERAAIYTTVAAYAERTGATVLAEGIETEAHLQQSLALGATVGQGWYFGLPGPLGNLAPPSQALGRRQPLNAIPPSPFGLVAQSVVRIASKGILLGISQHLEHQGLALETPPVVLSAFEEARYFTSATARRYSLLAEHCPIVATLGVGLPLAPGCGVRGVSIPADDVLREEWVVTVVGSHYAGALIARDLGDSGPDADRRFSFVLTHDHETVLAAARSLLERVSDSTEFPDITNVNSKPLTGATNR